MKSWLSIVIPVLNDATALTRTLRDLRGSHLAPGAQIIVVDGASTDASVSVARAMADRVILGPRGRAAQMNLGARHATGEYLWFLHADTRVPPDALAQLSRARANHCPWGRFDVRLDSRRPLLRTVGLMMNWRSRLTGIATGDQGLFVHRRLFEAIGGFAPIALMEDIELTARLKRIRRPVRLPGPLLTSARRWERDGAWRTILLMWRLRLAYFLGADPEHLARRYD